MRGFHNITSSLSSIDITVEGRIQGVGFRPFLYHLGKEHAIKGWVKNNTEGVILHAEGVTENLLSFTEEIATKAPASARVYSVHSSPGKLNYYNNFSIYPSETKISSAAVSEISPDIAVCSSCLNDMKNQKSRTNYFFTNCTNCGPRFSIIRGLPYDRAQTTMSSFAMCKTCSNEYQDIQDRRFHAQPVSCHNCGPSYSLFRKTEQITNNGKIIQITEEIIAKGGICAIKGLGGYHLACDPFNTEAVKKLRSFKRREGKPFAVMFASIAELKNHTKISKEEEVVLKSPEAPIVLVKLAASSSIAPSVYQRLSKVGAFLPYTPFYHSFFSKTGVKALVLTSGNFSNQPIIKDNKEALNSFLSTADAVVTYNREIYNSCDDSVGTVIDKKFHIMRRSRGWVPESLPLKSRTEGILAVGAELKTCFCIGKNNRAILSQHIGDLKNPETEENYYNTIDRFKELFNFSPSLIVHDLHPDYISTKYAEKSGLPIVKVQHHHAHIASCMAENGFSEKVIGFSFDGSGLGTDGNIWGGEVLVCSLENFQRKFHLKYLPLPGGDAVVNEPWRIAVAALYTVFGRKFLSFPLPFLRELDRSKTDMVLRMIEKNINTPLSSSIGRLFDTAAALLGLCSYSSFDAEGPMRMEALITEPADNLSSEYYPVKIAESIDPSPIISGIVDDILQKLSAGKISLKFHNSIIQIIVMAAEAIRKSTGLNTCALSGGVFMNTYLLSGCRKTLKSRGFTVLTQSKVPSNDGGIALGQIAVAACLRERGKL